LHETRLRAADYAVIAGSALFLAAAAIAYFGWGIGKFGDLLIGN
jgi:hypothetical protein